MQPDGDDPTRGRRRRRLVVLAALLPGLGLAGCASGGAAAAPPLGSAASRPALVLGPGDRTVSGIALGARITTAVAAHRTAHVRIHQVTGSTTTTGSGELRDDSGQVSMAVTVRRGSTDVRMRLLPDAFYLSTGHKIAGRSWLRVTPTGTDPVSRALAPLFAALERSGAVQRQAAGFARVASFTVAGTEHVGGRTVTHYSGTVPKSAQVAAAPEPYRKLVADQLTGSSPIDVWLDAGGLPVKVLQTSPLRTGSVVSSTEYGKWGQPVTIAAPPASDTTGPPSP